MSTKIVTCGFKVWPMEKCALWLCKLQLMFLIQHPLKGNYYPIIFIYTYIKDVSTPWLYFLAPTRRRILPPTRCPAWPPWYEIWVYRRKYEYINTFYSNYVTVVIFNMNLNTQFHKIWCAKTTAICVFSIDLCFPAE